jgi:hypothetical protein
MRKLFQQRVLQSATCIAVLRSGYGLRFAKVHCTPSTHTLRGGVCVPREIQHMKHCYNEVWILPKLAVFMCFADSFQNYTRTLPAETYAGFHKNTRNSESYFLCLYCSMRCLKTLLMFGLVSVFHA